MQFHEFVCSCRAQVQVQVRSRSGEGQAVRKVRKDTKAEIKWDYRGGIREYFNESKIVH